MKTFTAILSFCLLLNSSLGFWLSQNSCQNACTNEYKPEQSCQCNPECLSHNNCCSDYDSACQSCQDRCGNGLQNEFPCQCNDKCTDFKDCCADYDTICIGDHGDDVSDQELKDLTSRLFNMIKDAPANFDIDFQGETVFDSNTDNAPGKLINNLDESALFSQNVFKAMLPLMDNYDPDVKKLEDHTSEEQSEEDLFLNAVYDTQIMQETMKFLVDKHIAKDEQDAKNKIKTLWFQPYFRCGSNCQTLGSSGFEHVFVGESKEGHVIGFHGWLHFHLEEQADNLNYYGYLNHVHFGKNMYGITDVFVWNNEKKPKGGGFVGTPPELDLAVFSLCALTRSGSDKTCPVIFNGIQFNIRTYINIYQNHKTIGSAYPEF